jgi:putative oxidoreductase
MTTTTLSAPAHWLAPIHARLARFPDPLLLLAARVFPAAIFFQSGQTKVDGFALSENALFLFQEEYKLPLLPPELAATLAAVAEHVFPILLVLGLASRLSALALLGMTATIQIFVYPDAWPTHGVWAAALLLVATKGPGTWSLDRVIGLEPARPRGLPEP